jgi:hypothetical protein
MAMYLLSFGILGCHVKNIEVKVLAHVLSLHVVHCSFWSEFVKDKEIIYFYSLLKL